MIQVNMFLWSILLALTILRSAETCVPTVAPDEYYPTASLPEETTKPMEATTAAGEMSTTAGGGGATVASTTAAEENMCADCDFDALGPTIIGDRVIYGSQDNDPTAEGCRVTMLACRGPDGAICSTVEMIATNPTSSKSITDETSINSVVAKLTCEKNGLYSYDTFTSITAITCRIEGCVIPGGGR
ncbi:unnamed protein product [Caenorhabditis brenneri]